MGKKPRSRPEHLPEKLLSIRQQLGLSQAGLVELLQFKPDYHRVSEYESGRREPNLLVLLSYARLARVAVESLIDDELDLPLSFGAKD